MSGEASTVRESWKGRLVFLLSVTIDAYEVTSPLPRTGERPANGATTSRGSKSHPQRTTSMEIRPSDNACDWTFSSHRRRPSLLTTQIVANHPWFTTPGAYSPCHPSLSLDQSSTGMHRIRSMHTSHRPFLPFFLTHQLTLLVEVQSTGAREKGFPSPSANRTMESVTREGAVCDTGREGPVALERETAAARSFGCATDLLLISSI